MAKITPKGPDPEKVASNVYNKIFENKFIRVFDVRFKAGAKAPIHWHPNHFAYVLEAGRVDITPPKGDVMKVSAKAGDTMWIDAGHHEATNPGKADFHALIVELKGNTKKLGE
jgi:quercetin dioxygenase-like cupin family protein